MFAFVGLLAAPALMAAAPQQDLTLQQVAKAHLAMSNAIRSLHVSIRVSHNLSDSGKEALPDIQPIYIIEWYKDSARQRVRQNWLRGRLPHSSDACNGPNGFKALLNYDPNFTPPLSESIDGPARGETDKTRLMEGAFTYDPRGVCYLAFPKDGGFVTLEEYVTAYPNSELAATPATSKFGCYEIKTLEEVGIAEGSKDVRDMRIFLDPTVGFCVRRIERGPLQKSTKPRDKYTTITDVQEFKDCGNGIFWPLRVATTTRLPGEKVGVDILAEFTLHSINQPLPEEDFEIHFPDWLRIYDHSARQVIVWGPDDKPRMIFSPEAYEEWYSPRRADPRQEPNASRNRLLWLAGISILVGLLLLFLILRQRKKQLLTGESTQLVEKSQGDEGGMP